MRIMHKKKGITLVALVITIIIILILAGTGIQLALNTRGLLEKAKEAKFEMNLDVLEEELKMYELNMKLEGKTGKEKYPITEETMESIDKDTISTALKNKMLRWASTAQEGELATVDTIDYSRFYKIDETKIGAAQSFEGGLYFIEVNGEYKIINIAGEEYQGKTIHVLIPLDDVEKPQYITVNNNTYKLYGDGNLTVLGELGVNSGITSEENNNINGLKTFDLIQIAQGTTMAMESNVETDDEIAKFYGVKKLYFSCGTAYVIDANNDLWAWGNNNFNKLGQGNSFLVTKPIKVLEGRTEGASDIKAKDVWAGATNTIVLDTNHQLWICGSNAHGSLGQGNTATYQNYVPVTIPGVDFNTVEIKNIECSTEQAYSTIIMQCSDGKVYGVGYNYSGNLGIGKQNIQTEFIELSSYNNIWKNAKDIINVMGLKSYVLQQDGTLYGCRMAHRKWKWWKCNKFKSDC